MESEEGFMGVTHLSKSSAIFLSAAAPKTSTRRQLLPNDGKSFRSVAIPQCQITVPSVPEIVPYPDVNPSYSIVLSRILL
jgi:hypothetical protein